MSSDNEDKKNYFVDFLYVLNEKEDRGALSSLRKGLGKKPGTEPSMYKYVIPFIPNKAMKWEEDVYYIIASMFAMYPSKGGENNMGHVFRKLYELSESESIEGRFIALLRANKDEVPTHLRHAIALSKSKEIPIDWNQLFKDLKKWNWENRTTQMKWANSYWRVRTE